jgi:hypothetical protein
VDNALRGNRLPGSQFAGLQQDDRMPLAREAIQDPETGGSSAKNDNIQLHDRSTPLALRPRDATL